MTTPVVHCRDVRNRPQQLTVSVRRGEVLLASVPAETARLARTDAVALIGLLRGALDQLP